MLAAAAAAVPVAAVAVGVGSLEGLLLLLLWPGLSPIAAAVMLAELPPAVGDAPIAAAGASIGCTGAPSAAAGSFFTAAAFAAAAGGLSGWPCPSQKPCSISASSPEL